MPLSFFAVTTIGVREPEAPPAPAERVRIDIGRYVRSFGKDLHKGGHGIDVRKEGNEEFLYLCDITHRHVIKTTLKGEVIWRTPSLTTSRRICRAFPALS